jgi:transcription elongation factor GreA
MTATDDFLLDIEPEETSASAQGDDAAGPGFAGDEQTLVTKEGLRKLKEELEYLKTVRLQEVAQRLKEAISYGDLSENSEYEEAKNEQAFVVGRIMELEQKIKNAKIITEKKQTSKRGKVAEIGSTVTVRASGSDEESEFTIVGSTEADPLEHKISNESRWAKRCSAEREEKSYNSRPHRE